MNCSVVFCPDSQLSELQSHSCDSSNSVYIPQNTPLSVNAWHSSTYAVCILQSKLGTLYALYLGMTTQYKPKAIRGLKYPKHIKISIRQVEKLFENGQEFTGFLVGNNVNTFHFFGGWHLALTIKVTAFDIFKTYYNSFKLYLDPELGDNVAIFLEDSEFQK